MKVFNHEILVMSQVEFLMLRSAESLRPMQRAWFNHLVKDSGVRVVYI
jgi:hypothetical protein